MKMARQAAWRGVADWGKRRPAALRIADFLGRGRGRMRWLDRFHAPPEAEYRPDLSGWNDHELAAAWIGHATVLLRIGDCTVLTDPVMSNRIGVGLGLMTAGPRRLVAPALSIEQLPPVDLILISHAHYDHLDRPTLSRLNKRAKVITSHHNADLIADLGFRQVVELRWGESTRVGELKITAAPVRHWGARTFYDVHRGFGAFIIESSRRRVLYGGDTAYHEGFKEIGRVDLGIFGIGAYDPYIQAHATPEQALAMADHVRADHVLPMHHGTFRLSHEPTAEPLERMMTAARGDTQRIVIREIGQAWTF